MILCGKLTHLLIHKNMDLSDTCIPNKKKKKKFAEVRLHKLNIIFVSSHEFLLHQVPQ
jgi:hypothetical protein